MKNLSRRGTHDRGVSPLPLMPNLLLLLLFLFSATLPFSGAQSVPDPTTNAYGFRGGGINSSMTVLIVVLVCAFFFIGFFAVYWHQCTTSHHSDLPVNPRISAEGGLDPELIETFPIIAYSEVKDLKIGMVPLECAVCLNEFQDDESLRLLPKCDHVFHPDCIDEWLISNITCPVCRTDLATETGEIAGNSEQVPISNEPLSEKHPGSELGKGKAQVSINVPEDHSTVEIPPASPTLKQNRPPRSRSTRAGRFPRSHSTGHSLVQPGQNLERFTLRLPEEVRKQIAMNSMMNRTRSNGGGSAFRRAASSRTGYRSGGEGNGRGSTPPYLTRGSGRFDRMAKSDRWMFTMAPPFFSRAGSVRSSKMGGYGDNTAADGANAKDSLRSVKVPSDSVDAKADGDQHSSARPQV